MSDTPRTDEAELSILDIQNGHGPSPYVPAELARQLERELAAANKRAHYEATWHNHYARLHALSAGWKENCIADDADTD